MKLHNMLLMEPNSMRLAPTSECWSWQRLLSLGLILFVMALAGSQNILR